MSIVYNRISNDKLFSYIPHRFYPGKCFCGDVARLQTGSGNLSSYQAHGPRTGPWGTPNSQHALHLLPSQWPTDNKINRSFTGALSGVLGGNCAPGTCEVVTPDLAHTTVRSDPARRYTHLTQPAPAIGD
ncbi:hypothetical protein J6590_002215 [Homalodisca vitripennis]|nr:hypothetical protein J6590_002215 [Homalodisca vitripennis]